MHAPYVQRGEQTATNASKILLINMELSKLTSMAICKILLCTMALYYLLCRRNNNPQFAQKIAVGHI